MDDKIATDLSVAAVDRDPPPETPHEYPSASEPDADDARPNHETHPDGGVDGPLRRNPRPTGEHRAEAVEDDRWFPL